MSILRRLWRWVTHRHQPIEDTTRPLRHDAHFRAACSPTYLPPRTRVKAQMPATKPPRRERAIVEPATTSDDGLGQLYNPLHPLSPLNPLSPLWHTGASAETQEVRPTPLPDVETPRHEPSTTFDPPSHSSSSFDSSSSHDSSSSFDSHSSGGSFD